MPLSFTLLIIIFFSYMYYIFAESIIWIFLVSHGSMTRESINKYRNAGYKNEYAIIQ